MPSGRLRGAFCGLLAAFYLLLAQSALTCALHHGLDGACQMGATGDGRDAVHAGMDMSMPHGAMPDGPVPADGAPLPDAHHALCHCLDNLTAEAPALVVAAVFPPPLPPLPALATAPAQGSVHGPAAPRGPPAPSA